MSANVNTENMRLYRFGPLEKKGLVAGLRLGQILLAVGCIVTALFLFVNLGTAIGLLAFVVLLAVGFSAIFMEPMGRGIDEWIPVVFRWFMQLFQGTNSWVTPLPLMGATVVNGQVKNIDVPVPPTLKGLSILSVPLHNTKSTVGILKDATDGTYTGVIAVRGTAFALLDTSEKERRLASWGDILSGMARPGSIVHRVQWIERTLPDDGDEVNRYLNEARRQDDDSVFLRNYIDLLREFGPQNQQHESYIAVQIHAAKKASRAIRKAGGGDEGAVQVLVRELKQISLRLGEADIAVEGALTPRLLARVFRTAIDPTSSPSIARAARLHGEEAGTSVESAWPTATKTNWGVYQTDNAFHATYWISEWPRIDVGTDFIAPLMLRSSGIRTVALTMEPIDPSKASRDVESRRTSYMADEEMRNRAGYSQTHRRRNEIENVERREAELASGFVEYRIAGYITVTAMTIDKLEEACDEVEQAAQQSRLEVRRLFGEQDWAFTCTLPTARGLGTRR